jgi:hypothetical protein
LADIRCIAIAAAVEEFKDPFVEDFDGAIKETDHIIDAICGNNILSFLVRVYGFQFQGRIPRAVPEDYPGICVPVMRMSN